VPARFQSDAYSAGAICCLVVGCLILLAVVKEYRLLRVAVWGRQAPGSVEAVKAVKTDKFGDTIRWSSTITFLAEIDGKHPEIRFHEDHGYSHTRHQKVTVHYSPRRPEYLATIKRPQELLGRATGFTVGALLMISVFVIWATLGGR
jgi:hypothetical protein